ncbi:MAG: hypothetical protein RR784_01930 [Burkholderiaceae bacterium]
MADSSAFLNSRGTDMFDIVANTLQNYGWPLFLVLVALPGLIGLFYVGSNLWDWMSTQKAN